MMYRKNWRIGDLVQTIKGNWWRIIAFPMGVDGPLISVIEPSEHYSHSHRFELRSGVVAHVSIRRVSR